MTKNHVKTHYVNPDSVETAQRIASLTGTTTTPERWYSYDDDEYWYISAGLAWPTVQPGAVVVVGIKRSDPVTFRVMEAVSEKNVSGLIVEAARLQKKYQSDTQELLQVFWGEYDRYSGLLVDFNIDNKKGIYLSPPPDFDSPMAGLVYWRTIENYLNINNKRLFLNKTPVVPVVENQIAVGIQTRKAVHDFPPLIMALGFAVHAMRASRYWETNASMEIHIPTTEDILSQTTYHEEATLRELYGDTGDPDDDGGLVSTI